MLANGEEVPRSSAPRSRTSLRVLIGGPALLIFVVGALALLVHEDGARPPSALMGDGIDEYLADGGHSGGHKGLSLNLGSRSALSFVVHSKAHSDHNAHRDSSVSMFARQLGLTAFQAPKPLVSNDDDDSGSSVDVG